jgi:hypothetical protein
VARRSKRRHLYDDWNERHHWQRQSSPAIRDVFPCVKVVRIDLTFKHPDGFGDPKPMRLMFGPEQKAFFRIDCLFWECVRGGFDLGSAVRDAVRAQATSARGEQTCQGWQDPERIGKHRCWLVARYEIQIKYGSTTLAPSTFAFAPA